MPDNRARGIDVSQHQDLGSVHWVANAPQLSFMWGRISIGALNDDVGLQHTKDAHAAGYLTGGYHALHEGGGPARSQARRFFSRLLPFYKLPPMLDVERSGLIQSMVFDFCDEWAKLTDITLGIYTSQQTWHRIVGTSVQQWARRLPLWVAQYPFDPSGPQDKKDSPPEGHTPLIPNAWRTKHGSEGRPDWDFWQHTALGTLPGYPADKGLDRNVFWGTTRQLLGFVGEGDTMRYMIDIDNKVTAGQVRAALKDFLIGDGLWAIIPVSDEQPVPPPPPPPINHLMRDKTNQQVINLFNNTLGGYDELTRALPNWATTMATTATRPQLYSGPAIEEMPGLTEADKTALIAKL